MDGGFIYWVHIRSIDVTLKPFQAMDLKGYPIRGDDSIVTGRREVEMMNVGIYGFNIIWRDELVTSLQVCSRSYCCRNALIITKLTCYLMWGVHKTP